MVQVRTTIHPETPMEVTEQEADALRFQGLLLLPDYDGEIPAARTPRQAADQKKEGQE